MPCFLVAELRETGYGRRLARQDIDQSDANLRPGGITRCRDELGVCLLWLIQPLGIQLSSTCYCMMDFVNILVKEIEYII